MYVVAQFDPSVSFFNNGSVAVHVQSDILSKSTSGTVVIKNRTYFDLLFSATDNSRTFFVEQETARAFYFDNLQAFNLLYTPLANSGFAVANVMLPYQLTTIELYSENEPLVEVYPAAYPVFSLPSNEVVSRNSQLYRATSGVLTSPVSGDLGFSLFWPASNTRFSVLTILSIQLTTAGVVQVDMKPTGVDPNRAHADTNSSTNLAVGTAHALHVTHSTAAITKVAGQSMVTGTVPAGGVFEFIAPGVLSAQSQNYPLGGALGGGVECYMTPTAATVYSWNALWKEESN